MALQHFNYRIITSKKTGEVFSFLIDPHNWWMGIYNETIEGKSNEVNDEFTFSAGNGAHFTRQKLIELIPDKKIVWTVTESNLSFLDQPKEWEKTNIQFELNENADTGTEIIFTHIGLVPAIECYDQCSNGWMQYMKKLEKMMI